MAHNRPHGPPTAAGCLSAAGYITAISCQHVNCSNTDLTLQTLVAVFFPTGKKKWEKDGRHDDRHLREPMRDDVAQDQEVKALTQHHSAPTYGPAKKPHTT